MSDLNNNNAKEDSIIDSEDLSKNFETDTSNVSSQLLDKLSKHIKVICRVRPLNEKESKMNNSKTISIPHDKHDSIVFKNKIFKFDKVIPETASQLYLYETVAKPIITDVLNGFNGTIFAYGQTSSGKTFTMEGNLGDDELEGIIPRLSRDVFNHIKDQNINSTFIIKVSSFQLYMEKIKDMLNESNGNLSIHENENKEFYVKNLTFQQVNNAGELLREFKKGQLNRKTCATEMNEISSRSHSIFQIEIEQENIETGVVLNGKLYLVDLAGSETVSKTNAEGIVMREACEINKSLFELKKVIESISCNRQESFIYRNSKLTKILKESLGGNSLTTMIICVSSSVYNENETERTLRFGSITKRIKNQVKINEELTIDKWKELSVNDELTIRNLKLQLNQLKTAQSNEEDIEKNTVDEYNESSSYIEEIKCRYDEIIAKMLESIVRFAEDNDIDGTPELLPLKSEYINQELDEEYINQLKTQIMNRNQKYEENFSKLLSLSCEHDKLNSMSEEIQVSIDNMEIENLEIDIEKQEMEIKLLSNRTIINQEVISELEKKSSKLQYQYDELVGKYNNLKMSSKEEIMALKTKLKMVNREVCERKNKIEKMNQDKYRFAKLVITIDQKFIQKLKNIGHHVSSIQELMEYELHEKSEVQNLFRSIISFCNINDIQEVNQVNEFKQLNTDL